MATIIIVIMSSSSSSSSSASAAAAATAVPCMHAYIHQHAAAAASQTQASLCTFGEYVSVDVIRPLGADLQLRKSVRKGECHAVQCSPLCVPTLPYNFPSSLLPTCRPIKAIHQKWSKEEDRRLLAGGKEVRSSSKDSHRLHTLRKKETRRAKKLFILAK